jgi:hypothetical protein
VVKVEIRTENRHLNRSDAEALVRSLFAQANITEGNFTVYINRRVKSQRGKPEMIVPSISSEVTLYFSTWFELKDSRPCFLECTVESADNRRHGILEPMKELAEKLNSESPKLLNQLQKYLEEDKEQLRRLITKMRETRKKIHALQ